MVFHNKKLLFIFIYYFQSKVQSMSRYYRWKNSLKYLLKEKKGEQENQLFLMHPICGTYTLLFED